ncbi:MAG: FCSD flavin-binding domain-containing protein [Halothiobacillaceae bacterium]
MMTVSRRSFLKVSAGVAGAGLFAGCAGTGGPGSGKAHVVVIGGGFGGATAARYIRKFDPQIRVTMIDPKSSFSTCPASNWVLGGFKDMDYITHGFDDLEKTAGVNVVKDYVTAVDGEKRTVTLKSGRSMTYDRLVVSPGIDFKWEAIEGYGPEAAEIMPHAWQAGPQTELLRSQLEAMPDGGLFVMTAPPNPFRCPPGPYERAGLIANYFKNHKPRAKILILDAKDQFSKKPLFTAGWDTLYGDMIEWVGYSDGGMVTGVNTARMEVIAGETVRADVANVIPPQKAGKIAHQAGLTNDAGWCPVNHETYESLQVPNIHVVGDACVPGAMPKSGYSANSQAKICAAAVVSLINDQPFEVPSLVNTCYSLVSPDYGISVSAVYRVNEFGENVSVQGAGGVSPADGDKQMEALYAEGWYTSISDDIWGWNKG